MDVYFTKDIIIEERDNYYVLKFLLYHDEMGYDDCVKLNHDIFINRINESSTYDLLLRKNNDNDFNNNYKCELFQLVSCESYNQYYNIAIIKDDFTSKIINDEIKLYINKYGKLVVLINYFDKLFLRTKKINNITQKIN